MKTKNLDQLIVELTKHEGYRQFIYNDTVGKATVGIGRNLDDVGITKEEAQYLLRNDIKEALKGAAKFTWYSDLSDARKRVIVNMIFNIGLPRFKQFKKTIAHIKLGDYSKASYEMLDSRWANQVGNRAKQLAKLMRAG